MYVLKLTTGIALPTQTTVKILNHVLHNDKRQLFLKPASLQKHTVPRKETRKERKNKDEHKTATGRKENRTRQKFICRIERGEGNSLSMNAPKIKG